MAVSAFKGVNVPLAPCAAEPSRTARRGGQLGDLPELDPLDARDHHLRDPHATHHLERLAYPRLAALADTLRRAQTLAELLIHAQRYQDLSTRRQSLLADEANVSQEGKLNVMGVFDPRRPGYLAHAGTFNNNVLSMAAGYAGLTEVFTPEASKELYEYYEQQCAEMGQPACDNWSHQ